MIEERRSIRKFKGESVSKQHIEMIVEAARLAPSAKNRQPWKYLVYTGQKQNALLDVMESALKKEQAEHSSLPNSGFGLPDAFNTLRIMREAPVVLIVMNPKGKSPYESIDVDQRVTEICDSLSMKSAGGYFRISVKRFLYAAESLSVGMDARKKGIAVFFKLPLADTSDIEHIGSVFGQDGAHIAQRCVGEDKIRWDVFPCGDLFSK